MSPSSATASLPPASGRGGSRTAALLRFATLIAPQLLVSAAVITAYIRAFGLDGLRWLAWSHLLELAGLQALFFLAWGWTARRAAGRFRRWLPLLFTGSLLAAGLTINLLYAGQFLSQYIWGDPLSLAIARTWPRQFAGLRAACGAGVYAVAAVAAMVGLAAAFAVVSRARQLWAWLEWAAPSPRFYARVGRRTALVAGAATLVAAFAGFASLRAGHGGLVLLGHRSDPLLRLLLTPAKTDGPAPVEIEADLTARRDYPAARPGARRRHVILIVIDDLRADHLPQYGYPRATAPFLQELAQAGRLQAVEHTVAVSNATRNGVLGLLASRTPERLHLANFRLADVLQRQGYRTRFIGAGDHSTYADLRRFYADRLDSFTDGLGAGSFSVNDDRNVLTALAQLPASDGTPTFLHLHLMSVHMLGVRLPEWDRWPPAARTGWTTGLTGFSRDPAVARDLYDHGVLQADAYLRQIFAILEAKGFLSDYVAVITADHGEGLGAHALFGHGHSFYADEVDVPCFFLESGDFHYPRMEFASQVDIAPTLLDRLGFPAPSSWQGRSLLSAPPPTRAFIAATWPGRWYGVVLRRGAHRFKYVFTPRDDGPAAEQLFDQAADPGETANLLATTPPAVLRELRALVAGHFRLALP